MTDEVLAAAGISAGYGGADIVKDASLTADRGQMTVLLGPNGAGKSTLLKSIVGLIPRSAGRLTLDGVDVTKWPTQKLIRGGLSYVPQQRNIFATLTVAENLEVGGYLMKSGVRHRIAELLELFPALQRAGHRSAGTLSGGERSLLALARGLMTKPDVLLVDEPTSGLSPRNELIVWEHLDAIRKTGVTILAVEQNVARALEYCDVGYVLVLGQTVLHGSPSDLLASGNLASLYIGSEHMEAQQHA